MIAGQIAEIKEGATGMIRENKEDIQAEAATAADVSKTAIPEAGKATEGRHHRKIG